MFPFPNNPTGVYGENTFTQVLPASGRGVILSGRLDQNFSLGGRLQSLTGRYNFTDDEKDIPSANEALFSTVLSKIQTQNLSVFYNSQLNNSSSSKPLFNQFRFSFGRTHLNFEEVRDTGFLIPSDQFPNQPFLLNAPLRLNTTRPPSFEVPNTGPVTLSSVLALSQFPRLTTAEQNFGGPLGQISVAGFSTLGTDVYNFPQDRINKTFQFADEITWRLKGHSLVFGTDIRRTDLNSDLPRLSRPLLTFNGVPRLIDDRSGGYRFPTPNDPNPIIRPEDLVGLGAASNSLLTLNVDRPDSKVNLRFYQFNFYGQDTWRIRPNLSLSYGLRYEYNSPVNEVNRLIEETFTDQRLALVPGLNSFIGGRTNLYRPDRNNFAPRIGFAYTANPFDKNRLSVFRAGYGIFFDQILGAVANQSRNVFPTFLTLNFAARTITTLTGLQYENPIRVSYTTNQGTTLPVVTPGTTNTFNPAISLSEYLQFVNRFLPGAINATLPAQDLEMPMAHHYSFIFEQQLNSNFTFSIGYVGTSGRKLLRFTTPNLGSSLIIIPTQISPNYLVLSGAPTPVPPNYCTLNPDGCLPVRLPLGVLRSPAPPGSTTRPVAGVGAVNIFETTASSTYDSLQTQLQGRFLNNLNFQLSYTFSKVTDDVSDVFDLAGAYALPQNSFDLEAERGPANFDIRHRFAYEIIYSFPKLKGKFLGLLTNNLQIASLGRFNTGQPFTVNSIIDVNLDGNLTDRLNTTEGIEITGNRQQPLRLTTGNTLSLLAPFGQDGQVKRNSFRAGNVLDLNLSVIKQFVFGTKRLSFRADIFNFINRANFGVPVRLLEAPGFGRATNTITPGGRIQFALKYEF